MKRKLMRAAAGLIAAVLLPVCAQAGPAKPEPPGVSAKSALVLDCTGNRVLYEKNADEESLIASTTKIMTALVVAQQCSLSSRVRIPPEATGIEGSSIYLKAGEVLTVRELLYGMLLHSGNDAAVALAIFCAGDVGAFVELMNQKAADLGLAHTAFANPNGLDDEGNRSTARDLAILGAAALENETVAEIVATRSMTIGARCLTNHNKLLWRYEGAIGIKTGYTKAAGRILVSAAERDGRRLVAVTISAPDDWNDHARLLDYGFSGFELETVIQAGADMGQCRVLGCEEGMTMVPLQAAEDFSCALMEGETVRVQLELPGLVLAPVAAGETIGRATVWLEEVCLGGVDLVWAGAVARAQASYWPKWLQVLWKGR